MTIFVQTQKLDMAVEMSGDLSMYVYYCGVPAAVLLVSIVILLIGRKRKIKLTNVEEFLLLLDENKIFPINANEKWRLAGVSQGLRSWTRILTFDSQRATLPVRACYTVLHRPLEVVENYLKDFKSQRQWNPRLPANCRFRVFACRSDGDSSCSGGRGSDGGRRRMVSCEAQTDNIVGSNPGREMIRVERVVGVDRFGEGRSLIAILRCWGESLVVTKSFERCWSRQGEGEFWLVENSTDFKKWIFYLVNRVEESTDSCLLTIMMSDCCSFLWNSPRLLQLFGLSKPEKDSPTLLLAGLSHFVSQEMFNPAQLLQLPVKKIGLDGAGNDPDKYESGTSGSSVLRRKTKTGKNMEHPEVSLFQRFKNMLDDKKEEFDRPPSKTKRWSISSGENPALFIKKETESPISPMDIIKSISARFFDDKKSESDGSESGNSLHSKPEPSDTKKRWGRLSEAVNRIADERSGSGKKILHRTTSSSSIKSLTGPDSDLLQCLDTMIDNTALDIIAEKCKVANLDTKAKIEDQACQAGGWIYCGLEKDTVILKKVTSSPLSLHSYIGKGMVSYPPKLLYEVLKCPTSRLAYDDMIKSVEVLKEFQGGIKIIRLLYEVGQSFRRELREFIVLQGERIEGVKHVITIQSVDLNALSPDYPSCPSTDSATPNSGLATFSSGSSLARRPQSFSQLGGTLVGLGSKEFGKTGVVPKHQQLNDGAIPAKMFSSGWIIEPVMKNNKLCSMITYISQMKLDTGIRTSLSYMAEDIALKQPLCIVHLRHYMASLAASAEDELPHSAADATDATTVDCKRGRSVTLSITNALARFRNSGSIDRTEESEYDLIV